MVFGWMLIVVSSLVLLGMGVYGIYSLNVYFNNRFAIDEADLEPVVEEPVEQEEPVEEEPVEQEDPVVIYSDPVSGEELDGEGCVLILPTPTISQQCTVRVNPSVKQNVESGELRRYESTLRELNGSETLCLLVQDDGKVAEVTGDDIYYLLFEEGNFDQTLDQIESMLRRDDLLEQEEFEVIESVTLAVGSELLPVPNAEVVTDAVDVEQLRQQAVELGSLAIDPVESVQPAEEPAVELPSSDEESWAGTTPIPTPVAVVSDDSDKERPDEPAGFDPNAI